MWLPTLSFVAAVNFGAKGDLRLSSAGNGFRYAIEPALA
jgi:hypothetical protein